MTGKVIDLHTKDWKTELDLIYNELKDGTRRNAIIISEMPEDADDEEGALSVTLFGLPFSRYAAAMLGEAEMMIWNEYMGEEE